jgi:hypothetical protein
MNHLSVSKSNQSEEMKPSIIHSAKSTLNTLPIVILIGLGSPAAMPQADASGKSDEQVLRKLVGRCG